MKELSLIRNPDTRKSKILFIQDRLSPCEHVLGELYESKWYKYKALKSNFEKSLISNRKELKEMCEIGEKLPGELEPIILCKLAQVKLFEMQEEFVLAQEKAFDAVKYVSEKLEDFKNEFSDSSLDRKNENYKNPADFNKKKTLLKLKDQLVEPNEYIEYLLNTTLSFAMTVPEEVSVEGGESKSFWSKILSWIKRVFLFFS